MGEKTYSIFVHMNPNVASLYADPWKGCTKRKTKVYDADVGTGRIIESTRELPLVSYAPNGMMELRFQDKHGREVKIVGAAAAEIIEETDDA